MSADGERWVLLNASPDLRAQIQATPPLWPRHGLRSSPIAAVVLSGGDVDAIAGLLHLRERQPFAVYATGRIHGILAANPIFAVLAADCVARREVAAGRSVALEDAAGEPLGLTIELFPVPGKVPLYLETPGQTEVPLVESEDTVGVAIAAGDKRCFFIPGCAGMTPALAERLRGAPLVFFDGTLWRDDEMIRLGAGQKTGRRMGHVSLSGEAGVLNQFADLAVRRKVLIHINNTNPVLVDDSPERSLVEAAGWEVGYDGMEIDL